MNKKVMLGFAAVIAFFIGSILTSEFPIISSLVNLAEIAVGICIGYFWCKLKCKALIDDVREQYNTYVAENISLQNAYNALAAKKSSKSKKTEGTTKES